MPAYKLTYFNITGLAEPIRFLMHYGGIDFEDVRYSFEEFPKYKSQMPMEQIPVLEVDGKMYHQNQAILRYFAKKLKLYGSNDLEALEIDASLADIEDWRLNSTAYFREEDPTQKAKIKAVGTEKSSFFLGKFEERVKKNRGYFVNGKLTVVDIFFAPMIDMLSTLLEKDFLKDYPALKKLHDTVLALPKIKAYIDKRPKTDF